MFHRQMDRLLWILVGCAMGFSIVLIADPSRPVSADPLLATKSGDVMLGDARQRAIIIDQAVAFCDRNRLLIDAPKPQAPDSMTENEVGLDFRGDQPGRATIFLRPQPYEKDF